MIASDAFRASYGHVLSKDVVDNVARLFRAADSATSVSLHDWNAAAPAASHAPAILRPAFDRLTELAALEHDWDSYGGLPLSPEAMEMAQSFMIDVVDRFGRAGERAVPYSLMPIVDGGVQLEWRGQERDVELNIGPDRKISFLLVERREDGRAFSEGSGLSWEAALDLVRRTILA